MFRMTTAPMPGQIRPQPIERRRYEVRLLHGRASERVRVMNSAGVHEQVGEEENNKDGAGEDWQYDSDDGISAYGTWGNQTASLFGGTASGATAATGKAALSETRPTTSVPSDTAARSLAAAPMPAGHVVSPNSDKENLFDRQHDMFRPDLGHQITHSLANAKALAEWDRAEA